jgi:hypothetical protein
LRRLFLGISALCALTASPAYAVMEDYPSVKLQGLDKSVGRTVTFEAKVGSTIQYGPLFIKIHSCRKAPPIEKPESAAFLQIWEVPPGAEKSEWVFSGWMFASSPALSAMDHPVYDVWVLDCLGKEEPNAEAQAAQTEEQADQSTLPLVDGEAATETAPAQQSPVPTDSEAEEPFPTEEEVTPPETAPADVPVDSEAESEPAATAEEDKGLTAYDLMRQQQQNSAPVPLTPQVEETPPEY